MGRSISHLRNLLFITAIGGLIIAISCSKVGPVPDFVYSYDFKPDLPTPDVSSINAQTVVINPGDVDTQGISNFAAAILNPTQAKLYASAVDQVLNASQESYWIGQTTTSIRTALEGGNTTAQSQTNSARSAFQSNSTLSPLLPALIGATGSLSSARIGYNQRLNSPQYFSFHFVQSQTEFDDCRQAAQDAYDIARNYLDSAQAAQLALINTTYNTEFPLVESQRAALESAAQTRYSDRLAIFLNLHTGIAATISSLFGAGDITAAERNLLDIANIILYAIAVRDDLTLLNQELTLINSLLGQATTNINTARNNLITSVTRAYNNEVTRIDNLLLSIQSSCHNQGGVNTG
ncbi:MAG: hypothetical protein ACFHWX_13390 [Bacteroidota bacterium]